MAGTSSVLPALSHYPRMFGREAKLCYIEIIAFLGKDPYLVVEMRETSLLTATVHLARCLFFMEIGKQTKASSLLYLCI